MLKEFWDKAEASGFRIGCPMCGKELRTTEKDNKALYHPGFPDCKNCRFSTMRQKDYCSADIHYDDSGMRNGVMIIDFRTCV
jgi:C4-type Zn-finger protein